jgi:hypothetical protein
MKRVLEYGTLCATMLLAASCGEKKAAEPTAPEAEAVAYADTVKITNGKGVYYFMEVKGYNAQGQLAVIDGYNVSSEGNATYAEQTLFQGGRKVYAKSVDAQGNLTGEEQYTYNGDQLAEVLTREFSDEKQKMLDKSKVTYTYDAQGNVTSIVEQLCENLHWNNSYEWDYSYNEHGQVVDRKDFAYGAANDRKQSRWETYEYDGDGRLATYDLFVFDQKKGKQKHDSKTTYTYNPQGLVTSAVTERHKSTLKRESVKSRIYTFDYNENGQLTYFSNDKWKDSDKSQTTQFSTNNTYDEQGRLVQQNNISQIRPQTGSSFYAIVPAANAQATPAAETRKVDLFIPAANGKPVIDLSEANRTLTEPKDE